MIKINNLGENTSKLFKIVVLSFMFVGCSTVTESDVHIITEAKDLVWLADQDFIIVKNIRFDADIDMKGIEFYGIPKFTGIMDGNGKKILNLNINYQDGSSGCVGLIQHLGDAGEIKNLTIESGSIKNLSTIGNKFVGAFVGFASGNNINIENVTNKASVEGVYGAGGITKITHAYNYTDIKLSADKWSIPTITDSYNLDTAPTEDDGSGSANVPKLNVEAFTKQESFDGWNFTDIWELKNGKHPTLIPIP